jgi:hypothetical protein
MKHNDNFGENFKGIFCSFGLFAVLGVILNLALLGGGVAVVVWVLRYMGVIG